MKLFLSSIATSSAQAPYFTKLVGKVPEAIKLALIENAAEVEAGSKEWLTENRQAINSHGFEVEMVDLKAYQGGVPGLKEKLASKDVIWLGGGNTYYLRWLLRDTGADDIIKELIANGTIYGGGSAGAIVAGPTLKHFEAADDPREAPEVILDGLNLTDKVVVPHMDNEKFTKVIHGIHGSLKADGYNVVPLTDAQALVVDGERQSII